MEGKAKREWTVSPNFQALCLHYHLVTEVGIAGAGTTFSAPVRALD